MTKDDLNIGHGLIEGLIESVDDYGDCEIKDLICQTKYHQSLGQPNSHTKSTKSIIAQAEKIEKSTIDQIDKENKEN